MKEHNKLKKNIWLFAILFLVVTGIATVLLWPYMKELATPEGQAAFQAWVSKFGWGGIFILFLIQILQIVIAFIPGGPLEIIAGMVYGGIGGLLICLAGSVVASTVIFLVVRVFGMPLLYKLFGREKIDSFGFLKDNKRIETVTFILFLIPGFPKDLLTYLAGVSEIKMSRFLVIANVARTPAILTSTMMGASLGDGNWVTTILLFVLTGVFGIIGIRYKDGIMDRCRSYGRRRKVEKFRK